MSVLTDVVEKLRASAAIDGRLQHFSQDELRVLLIDYDALDNAAREKYEAWCASKLEWTPERREALRKAIFRSGYTTNGESSEIVDVVIEFLKKPR